MEKEENKSKANCNNKKKLFAIIGAVVVLVVAIVLLIIFVGKSKNNEKELKANLEKLGVQFYEKFYYPAQEKSQKDVKSFIAKFEKTGIKVNLENIAKVSVVDKELVQAMVNSKTEEKCDAVNSYVVIKPTEPYGAKDHKVEVVLSCGFDKKEEKKETKKEETKKETTKKEETKKETTKKETVKKETKKK